MVELYPQQRHKGLACIVATLMEGFHYSYNPVILMIIVEIPSKPDIYSVCQSNNPLGSCIIASIK